MSVEEINFLLKKYNIKPDAVKGQHFLTSDKVLQRIIESANISDHDRIIEIGPGIGNMTVKLASLAKTVIAIELDKQFKPILDSIIAVNKNVYVEYGDIMRIDFSDLARKYKIESDHSYSVIANIPYYLTSKLISHVLKYPKLPKKIIFMIQKEVAERVVAEPGNHSKLSLSVQFYASPHILFNVQKSSFIPMPEVNSSVIEINDIHRWNYDIAEQLVWQLIRIGFSSKRKKLLNNLSAGLQISKQDAESILRRARIEPGVRAEDINVDQWLDVARVWNSFKK